MTRLHFVYILFDYNFLDFFNFTNSTLQNYCIASSKDFERISEIHQNILLSSAKRKVQTYYDNMQYL